MKQTNHAHFKVLTPLLSPPFNVRANLSLSAPLSSSRKKQTTHLQEFLLLNGTILINVHLGDEVPEFVVAALYFHVLQSSPQVVNADVAVLVLVEALEDLGVVFGLLVAEVNGSVPYLTGYQGPWSVRTAGQHLPLPEK